MKKSLLFFLLILLCGQMPAESAAQPVSQEFVVKSPKLAISSITLHFSDQSTIRRWN